MALPETSISIVFLLILTLSFVLQSCEARKVLMPYNTSKGLLLNALPKGNVPSSGPSDKSHTSPPNDSDQHMVPVNPPVIYRRLGSAPSPGVGHKPHINALPKGNVPHSGPSDKSHTSPPNDSDQQPCEARKVLMPYNTSKGLLLNAQPKDNVPPSGPSDKGHTSPPGDSNQHMVPVNPPVIYRRLGSAPSPGVGHKPHINALPKGNVPPSGPSDKSYTSPPNDSDQQPCEARKVLMPYNTSKGLFLNAQPKDNVPPSGPSDKGHTSPPGDSNQHMVPVNPPVIYRRLGSAPSPGVGHKPHIN